MAPSGVAIGMMYIPVATKTIHKAQLQEMKKRGEKLKRQQGKEQIQIKLKDKYDNMRKKGEPVMDIVDRAKEDMLNAGLKPNIKAIRGGTDG